MFVTAADKSFWTATIFLVGTLLLVSFAIAPSASRSWRLLKANRSRPSPTNPEQRRARCGVHRTGLAAVHGRSERPT